MTIAMRLAGTAFGFIVTVLPSAGAIALAANPPADQQVADAPAPAADGAVVEIIPPDRDHALGTIRFGTDAGNGGRLPFGGPR